MKLNYWRIIIFSHAFMKACYMFMLLLVLTTADLFNMIPIQLSDKIFAFVDKLQISLTARVSVDSLQMEEAARLL